MPANTINSTDLKASLNRQTFLADVTKHGLTTAMGAVAGAVSYYGFGIGAPVAALIGVSTKAGSDVAIDLAVKPLWLNSKIADRAQAAVAK